MRKTLLEKISVLAVLCFAAPLTIFAQSESKNVEKINFRYSQNPKIKTKTPNDQPVKSDAVLPHEAAANDAVPTAATIAKNNTANTTGKSGSASLAPTDIYKVGIGDVLFINLQNAPKDSTYYTVLGDGTIDYPLAGEMVSVLGTTTDEIEIMLREKIKLYENPQISVRVRDYASHSVKVLGLIENPGDKKMQREAVPLFLVRAEAIVQAKATQAIIRRKDATVEKIELHNAKADEVLIYPGDIVEFTVGEENKTEAAAKFYFIGGEIASGGQKDFHQGITLTQAIIASGGLRKPGIKTATIRRKNANHLLESTEYNLKAIKEGKMLDPVLEIGDTIEVGI